MPRDLLVLTVYLLWLINTARGEVLKKHQHVSLPQILEREYEHTSKLALDRLLDAINNPIPYIGGGKDKPFEDILESLPIPKALLHVPLSGTNQDDKFFIGADVIREKGRNFTIYAFGTAGEVIFENCKYNICLI